MRDPRLAMAADLVTRVAAGLPVDDAEELARAFGVTGSQVARLTRRNAAKRQQRKTQRAARKRQR